MSTIPIQRVGNETPWRMPSRGVVAMACLITAESAIFTIFVVAYLYYLGRDVAGPTPREVLALPIFGTVCLLSSSFFIWLAEHAIEHAKHEGVHVMVGHHHPARLDLPRAILALEWYKLIVHDHLTIRTNLFGTTFYSLVGLHASHVIIGLLMMLVVIAFSLTAQVCARYMPSASKCSRCTGTSSMPYGSSSLPWSTS